jgi:drug/metabolite transporter (DMT)-like permease
MEEMTLGTMLAVFEEMFGRGLFWAMVAVAAIVTVGYIYVLIRDREMSMRKFLLAQLSMPLGGIAAVWFVLWVTRSGLQHMGGPIDALLLLAIFGAGAVGFAILVYVAQSLVRGKQTDA